MERENTFHITSRALELVARIMVSCRVFRGDCTQHDNYLMFAVKKRKDWNFRQFISGVVGPNYLEIYEGLATMAKKMDKPGIDVETVCYFFGGHPHIEKIHGWLEKPESRVVFPEEERRMQFFLTHLLLPVTIESEENGVYVGKYVNNKKIITLRDLVPFTEDNGKVVIDQYVLIHFSSIVSINEEKIGLLRSRILKEQWKDGNFRNAIEFLDGQEIHQENHRRFTERIMNLYNM
jgi:hypothetical protein